VIESPGEYLEAFRRGRRATVWGLAGRRVRLGTWEAVLELAEGAYPELRGRLCPHLEELQKRTFEDLQAESGLDLAEIYRVRRGHGDFFSPDRLLVGGESTWEVRALLFHELHLNELYSGDGWTRHPAGRRGLREFLPPYLFPSRPSWRSGGRTSGGAELAIRSMTPLH
jgi:hypothetical protein